MSINPIEDKTYQESTEMIWASNKDQPPHQIKRNDWITVHRATRIRLTSKKRDSLNTVEQKKDVMYLTPKIKYERFYSITDARTILL